MNETIFHLLFVLTFLAFTAIRAYYQRQATMGAGQVEYKEGRAHNALRKMIGIPWILCLLIYLFQPGWFAWAHLPLPDGLRWTGAGLGLASLPLIWWVQYALGINFSVRLHVRSEHTLVTDGPYRWVRHPMYTALFIWAAALLLLSANWLIAGVPMLALIVIVVLRIENEEQAMVEKFGDLYREYIRRTGRFLPRLGAISYPQSQGS